MAPLWETTLREKYQMPNPTQWNYMRIHYVEPATNDLADEKSGFE